MPTPMHADMATAERDNPDSIFETVEFTLGGDEVFRYSPINGGVVESSAGLFIPGLITRGPIPAKMGWPAFNISLPSVSYRVKDHDRRLQSVVGGKAQGTTRGSPFVHYRRSSDVVVANHFKRLEGIILDMKPDVSKREYEVVVGPATGKLGLTQTLNIDRLTSDIWENIPDENRDAPGVALLGDWVSAGVNGALGMVPATLVDKDNGIWFVSAGFGSKIDNIHVNDVSDTDWTELGTVNSGSIFVRGGRPFSVIQDTASTLRTVADKVTCDFRGPTTVGTLAAGTTLDAPASMLRVALANFVFNRFPTGATRGVNGWDWYAKTDADANTPWDDAADVIADAWFASMGVTASMLLTSDTTAKGMMDTFQSTFRANVAFNSTFQLGVYPIIINPRNLYGADHTVVTAFREIRRITGDTFGSEVVTAHTTSHLFDASRGMMVKKQRDANRFCFEQVHTPLELTYARANAGF